MKHISYKKFIRTLRSEKRLMEAYQPVNVFERAENEVKIDYTRWLLEELYLGVPFRKPR